MSIVSNEEFYASVEIGKVNWDGTLWKKSKLFSLGHSLEMSSNSVTMSVTKASLLWSLLHIPFLSMEGENVDHILVLLVLVWFAFFLQKIKRERAGWAVETLVPF